MNTMDLAAKLDFRYKFILQQSIDVSNLPVGIYTVLIYNGYNNVEVEKLIKMQ